MAYTIALSKENAFSSVQNMHNKRDMYEETQVLKFNECQWNAKLRKHLDYSCFYLTSITVGNLRLQNKDTSFRGCNNKELYYLLTSVPHVVAGQ